MTPQQKEAVAKAIEALELCKGRMPSKQWSVCGRQVHEAIQSLRSLPAEGEDAGAVLKAWIEMENRGCGDHPDFIQLCQDCRFTKTGRLVHAEYFAKEILDLPSPPKPKEPCGECGGEGVKYMRTFNELVPSEPEPCENCGGSGFDPDGNGMALKTPD